MLTLEGELEVTGAEVSPLPADCGVKCDEIDNISHGKRTN